jgi:UDP-2,3-diacylglucosamine pyrophosphatase LpxH
MQQCALDYRSVFVSDLHLGSVGCKAESVRHFLHDVRCEYLYLVGDIIDMWVGARSDKWKQAHTNVIRTILSKSSVGCIVRYAPGNHDALVRRLNGAELGNIIVNHSFSHLTADGKRLLVVHGDRFDRTVTTLKPLAWLGAWSYELLTAGNERIDVLRGKPQAHGASFSASAKKRLKRGIACFTRFEERITRDALRQGYDGVVCGHVHRPGIDRPPSGGLYINTGDWVEHCTAIVEHWDGRLELIRWADLLESINLAEMPVPADSIPTVKAVRTR